MQTMKNFLISFCNNQNHISANAKTGLVGMLSVVEDRTELINISMSLPKDISFIGATGLTCSKEHIYLIGQSRFSQLIILDKSMNVIGTESLEPLKGVHSIRFKNNFLYMVATKQDKIVKYHLGDQPQIESIYDLNTGKDTHHLNSICLHEDQVLASGFGDNEKEFWMHAENGYVFDVKQDKKVIKNLKQPHSLFSFDDRLYVCDSSRKRVVDQSGNVHYQSQTGYIRGLYIEKDMMLVGHSKGRVVSHSQGKYIGNIADKGMISGECGVVVIQNKQKHFVDCSKFADEIYDILPLQL